MAEYPLRYSPQALKYLSDHANEINFVAGSLGVSPLSVAAGIAREQSLESDIYPYQARHIIGNPIRQVETYLLPYSSDRYLRSIYDATNKLDPETLMYPGGSAVRYPMLFDVGPGNIKLRTAISLLDNYNSQYQGESDFLGLNRYNGNLPQFINDLRNPGNPLTANVSGLLASEATQYYKYHMTPAGWDFLPDDQKAAAVTQYYVRGPEKLAQEAGGQRYWFPDFSKPGSSFYNYKDNANVLRAALGYNTYPLDQNAPQPAPASIGTFDNSPYAYVNVPYSAAMPKNTMALYAQQAQAAPSIGNALNSYGGVNAADVNASAPMIGNALIPQNTANGAADTLDPSMLATMALIRAFGLPPGTDIATQSLAQP
ncbi:MAG: hypothetical protein ACLPWS_03060 [Rhodomicrobium sp.]